jgi:signal transduction histidine kinase
VWTLVFSVAFVAGLVSLSRQDLAREVQHADAQLIAQARVLEAGPALPRVYPALESGALTALPDNWDSQRPGYAGYVWYGLDTPQKLLDVQRPAIFIPSAAMNVEVWLNGQRVGGQGRMTMPVSRHFYTPQLVEIPRGLLHAEASGNRLALLVAGYPGYRSGLAPVWVGEHDPLFEAWRWRRFWQTEGNAATIVVNLAIAVFVMLIARLDRSHSAHLWFGAAAAVWALRNLNYWVVHPVIPDLLFAKLCVSGAAWFVAFLAIFAMRFTQSHLPDYKPPRFLLPAALAYAALTTGFFLKADDYASANTGFPALAAIGIAFTLWSVARLVRLAWARPDRLLIAVAAGALIYLLLLVNDYAIGADRLSLGEIFVRQYAALPLFLAITGMLSQRYRSALRESQDWAASLQTQVTRQREQLALSFERLRQIERDQAREQERARLMGDLHDGLGMHLATALRQARTPDVSRDQVANSLEDCMDELRVAVDSLDEHARDPVSLLGSLRYRMAPRFEALGLQLHWRLQPELPELPEMESSQALHLLRIVQEALGNALKHSRASSVTLAISCSETEIRVQVSDNGCGFAPPEVARGHGLGHMESRAQRMGGRLEWGHSASGTSITVHWPRS